MTLRAICNSIEKEAARRAKQARSAYETDMKAVRATFQAEQRKIEFREKEELKEIERWRVNAIAAADPSRPAHLSDITSVKREVEDGFDRKTVSLAAVSFIDKPRSA